MTLEQLDGFVVCLGPGAFTGLRVGIAAVEGLSLATGKPAAGLTSLEASAFASIAFVPGSLAPASFAPTRDGRVCALVNAYKGEVYSQMFEFDERGSPVARNEPLVSTSEQAIQRLAEEEEIEFTGNAVRICEDLIRDQIAGGRKWSVTEVTVPLAESLARLAIRKSEAWENPLRASYIRPAEAEIKLAAGLLGSKIKRTLSHD